MKFTLDAGGAQAAGQGIGSLFKAYALGPMYRQQAEMDAATKSASAYANNMQGNKLGSEAEANSFTLDQRRGVDANIAANPAMTPYERLMHTTFKLTGDTNAERVAKAGTEFQTQGLRDRAAAAPDVDSMNRLISVVADKPYMPFDNVGNTGQTINKATGAAGAMNPVLAKLYDLVERAKANENNAQAGNAGASAALTNEKRAYLKENKSLPGSGAEGSEGALSSTILDTIKIPVLNAKGKEVRNPITGAPEYARDPEALKAFYGWVANEKRRPTATAFAQWEAQGRPGNNKSPAAAPAAPKIDDTARDALAKARAAIANGAPRDKVLERLKQNGINPAGL